MPGKKAQQAGHKKKKQTAKEKKAAIRAQTAALAARKALLDAAASAPDALAGLAPFRRFARNGLALAIEYRHSSALADAELDACFALLKRNMRQHYIDSHWGWTDRQKMAELKQEQARFLLVRDEATQALQAFAHLRFDWEDDNMVLYVYEIQLEPAVRRKGLGKFLMQTMELMARRAEMEGVLLTVLGTDSDAMAFYRKIGFVEVYSTDEELLDADDETERKEYALMSKDFRPPEDDEDEDDSDGE